MRGGQAGAMGGQGSTAAEASRLGGSVLFICLLAGVSAFFFNHFRPAPLAWDWRPPPPAAPTLTDLAAFRQALARPETVLVDARPALFYKMSHIPGAVSLPDDAADAADLAAWRTGLAPDAAVIIYCTDDLCHLADQLARKLLDLGLTPTIFLPGFSGWEAAGLPVASGLTPRPEAAP